MNILFTRFPLESRHGGAEVQTISLMRNLRARGHRVAFLGSCPILLQECKKLAIPAAELNIGPPPVTPFSAISFLWRKRRMRRLLADALDSIGQLDAVMMLSLNEKLLLTPVALGKNIRVLWIEHDRIGRWLRWNPWLPQLLRLSRRVTTVTVSELSRSLYVHIGFDPDRTVAIPNGIERPSSTHHPNGMKKPDGVHIGCIARLSYDKGVDLLIEAVRGVENARLTIVGFGREEAAVKDHLKILGHRAVLHPSIPDITAFVRSLDILVLPSRLHDPFGLVAAEAMMLGIPVVVTDQCGIAGYLTQDQDAVIVPADSAVALQEALALLANDPAKRAAIAGEGKRTAERLFAVDRMTDEYLSLLDSRP
ncbi:MAG: glycosyltransferase family 4 protein [Candidatus Peregrinibacteria bacterium]